MTTPSPSMSCRFLESLWPAPASFSAIGAEGACLAGDVGLAGRAVAALAGVSQDVLIVRDGDLLIVRSTASGQAMAAEVPGGVLPRLLEADLLRVTSEAE